MLSSLTLITDQCLAVLVHSVWHTSSTLHQYSNRSQAKNSMSFFFFPKNTKHKNEFNRARRLGRRSQLRVPVWADGARLKVWMDRCCCQDLSAKTNGCCKDEASNTLENSKVVNHQPACVCVWMKCMYRCVPYCGPPTQESAGKLIRVVFEGDRDESACLITGEK